VVLPARGIEAQMDFFAPVGIGGRSGGRDRAAGAFLGVQASVGASYSLERLPRPGPRSRTEKTQHGETRSEKKPATETKPRRCRDQPVATPGG